MRIYLICIQYLSVFIFFIVINIPGYSSLPERPVKNHQDTVSKKDSNTQPVYITSRLVTVKPVIDGKLDDECWKNGTWAGNFTQFVPNEGADPSYPTELNIQYDDKNIYIAFRCYDGEPDKILRQAGLRDEQVGDIIGLSFDSYRDYRTGFDFSLTAWGQKGDLVLFNPMNWDSNWNPVWKGKVEMGDSVWFAEMEVPLSQLRYSKEDEQVWGMHTWRWIARLQEESNWEIQSKTGPGMLYNFGEVRGIKGLKKSRRLEIMPYALGDLMTMKKTPGNPFTENGRSWGGNIGLDAKIGISSNFTVDLTVNPDFGQVESDPSVMNLTAFETLFDEKRPFFLEGLTIFENEFDDKSLFYSRRIGHSPSLTLNPNDSLFVNSPDKTTILSAVKLSGTTSNGLSVGLIHSVTANEYANTSDIDGNRRSSKVEPLTNYLVARIQKGYNEGNTVFGGLLTSTNRYMEEGSLEFLTSDAYTGGLDLLHHMKDKEFFIDARMLGSYVSGSKTAITALQESSARYFQRPGADYLNYDSTRTSLRGFGGKLRIGKGSKGLWRYSTGATFYSPGLELNDLGYMKSSDEINQENEISYFVNRPVSIFNTYNITLEQFNSWNFNGAFLETGGHLSFASEFTNLWSLGADFICHSRAIDTRILRGGYDMLMPARLTSSGYLKSDPSKKITTGIEYKYKKSGNNSASGYSFEPGITIRPITRLKFGITANYEINNDRLQYVATKYFVRDNRYILGSIDQKTLGLTFRVDLYLIPEFSIQYYGSPFISRGSYSEFKYVTNPGAKVYEDQFEIYSDPVSSGGKYYLYDYDDGLRTDYSIVNPDFNFHQFRSNLVAKWEYRLGSFIYLVWSGERTLRSNTSNASIGDSYRQLYNVYPNNIFLIKLNYWFSI
jgi:Domain of unknown function (DUF5916)